MTLIDIGIFAFIFAVVLVAVLYIRKEKKQGKCVGCPYAKECAAKKAGQSCESHNK